MLPRHEGVMDRSEQTNVCSASNWPDSRRSMHSLRSKLVQLTIATLVTDRQQAAAAKVVTREGFVQPLNFKRGSSAAAAVPWFRPYRGERLKFGRSPKLTVILRLSTQRRGGSACCRDRRPGGVAGAARAGRPGGRVRRGSGTACGPSGLAPGTRARSDSRCAS